MDSRIEIFLVVSFIAFVSSFIIQTIFQQFLGGKMSVWGGNPGWQREIAFWNVCCAIIAILSLIFGNTQSVFPVVIGFTVLFILLGTNHLFAVIKDPKTKFHWPPLILNYIGAFFGVQNIVLKLLGYL
jgi:hypothetical protein